MQVRTVGWWARGLVGLTLVGLGAAACSSATSDDEDGLVSDDGLTESTECSGAAILARIPEGPRRDVVARAVWRVGSAPKYNPKTTSGGYRNDCSGFTAMAWSDTSQPGTALYPPFHARAGFVEIPFDQLQPGDALNRTTQSSCKIGTCGHIRLFGGFIDGDTNRFCVLEHAAPYGAPPKSRLGKADDLKGYAPIKNAWLPDVTGSVTPPPSDPVPVTPGCGVLGVNEALGADQAKTSCDGRFSLVMQSDGNVVLYQNGTALWNSQTMGSGGSTLAMQGDGNLVVYQNGTAGAVWNSGTNGNPGATLLVQDDGNVALVNGSKVLWSTHTGGH
ncbi:hypothetical protein BH09MYX1_BH09MYX1_03370 [soil metagenome]